MYRVVFENLKVIDHLENIIVDGVIILKKNFKRI